MTSICLSLISTRLQPVNALDFLDDILVHRVQTPMMRRMSALVSVPSVSFWHLVTFWPSSTMIFEEYGTVVLRSSPVSSSTTVKRLSFLSSSTRTVPSKSANTATFFGLRASKISSTRGRPCVMSPPATPPEWKVRIVSCVPGSPMDCAAMMPTASPMETGRPLARFAP